MALLAFAAACASVTPARQLCAHQVQSVPSLLRRADRMTVLSGATHPRGQVHKLARPLQQSRAD